MLAVLDPAILIMLMIALGLWSMIAFERPLERLHVPVPLIYVAVGYAAFALPLGLPALNVLGPPSGEDPAHALAAEHITELVVIISLLAAGLAIDRPFSIKRWGQVWPLLAITMPASIAAMALLGWWWLGLPLATAVLLGAVLSPTDPVLARHVQVGPPGKNGRDDARFNLSLEAGLNDALAFPFVYLALGLGALIALAPDRQPDAGAWATTLLEWLAIDVGWRVLAGLVVGVAVGRGAAWFAFTQVKRRERGEDDEDQIEADAPKASQEANRSPNQDQEQDQKQDPDHSGDTIHTHDHKGSVDAGLMMLALLLASYAIAETIEGYGFLAVFAGAVAARQYHREHGLHARAHEFMDQVERLVMVVALLGLGGLLASGVLDSLTWTGTALAVVIVFVVRPLAGWLGMLFRPLPLLGTLAVAFLGVRGIGTLYYLCYARNQAELGAFPGLDQVWAVVAVAIPLSMLVHGVSAKPILSRVRARGHHVLADIDRDDSGLSR